MAVTIADRLGIPPNQEIDIPEMNDTQPTLFQRLAHIRAAVERARADVLQLRRSIRNIGKSAERSPAEDMAIQLN
jgi:hypothetical protein